MPSRNALTGYTDLGYTFYPTKIDSRTLETAVYGLNEDLELNVNYEDRGSDPTADDFYVLAQDVNVLQDGVLAIQRVLGVMPHVRTDVAPNDVNTVSERIAKLEIMTRFDSRFGGAGWVSGTSPTILSHTHTGGANDCAKIDLGTMTTGELGKTRLQLDITDADPLTSALIPYSATDATSVKTLLDRKADKTADTIFNLDVTIKGNLISRSHAEVDGIDIITVTESGYAAPSKGSDPGAYCGEAMIFNKASGILPTYSSCYIGLPLRYGDYSVIVRMKTDNNTSDSNLARIGAYGYTGPSSTATIYNEYVKCTRFASTNEYQSFHFVVSHKRLSDTATNKNLYIKLWYYGNAVANLYLDSIVVTPIHNSVWDDKGVV